MAKPPEPIEEVLPKAVFVLDAEVIEVLENGPMSPRKAAPAGATSVGNQAQAQKVKLKVNRVLRGKPVAELVVDKPEAGYALTVGNHGPFLIDDTNSILGRYGPDSYDFSTIEAALKKS